MFVPPSAPRTQDEACPPPRAVTLRLSLKAPCGLSAALAQRVCGHWPRWTRQPIRAVTSTGLVVAAGSLRMALLESDTLSGQSAVSSHRASEWCWEGIGSGRTVAASASAHDSHRSG